MKTNPAKFLLIIIFLFILLLLSSACVTTRNTPTQPATSTNTQVLPSVTNTPLPPTVTPPPTPFPPILDPLQIDAFCKSANPLYRFEIQSTTDLNALLAVASDCYAKDPAGALHALYSHVGYQLGFIPGPNGYSPEQIGSGEVEIYVPRGDIDFDVPGIVALEKESDVTWTINHLPAGINPTITVTQGTSNIRECPDQDCQILKQVQKGTQMVPEEVILEQNLAWYHVRQPADGWIRGNSVEPQRLLAIPQVAWFGATATAISSPTPKLGLCPIDLEQQNVYFFAPYGLTHSGIDIAGERGTPHISPGDCNILYFYIQNDNGQGVMLRCSNLPELDRISLHHIDLAWNGYETLKWYRIPIEALFDPQGKPIKETNYIPTRNSSVSWGEPLYIFMGNSGSTLIHTHIGAWTLENNVLSEDNDPLEYLSCDPNK
jgi:hypothetical protein